MRFDLEFNIVEQLTQEGLSLLADSIYDTNKNANHIIAPAKWDDFIPDNSIFINTGLIDTSKYKKLTLPSWLYNSGVASEYDLLIESTVVKNNLICPIFKAGEFYSYRNKYTWSNNQIVDQFKIKDGYYYCGISENTDIGSIEVYTMKLDNPGILEKYKVFEYVEYDDISVKTTFARSDKELMFTVVNNEVLLNISPISYTEKKIGVGYAGKNNLLALPEFPVMQDENGVPVFSINNHFSNTNTRLLTSIVMVRSTNDADIDVLASYTVAPLITYRMQERTIESDSVWRNINLTPSAISFKDGLVCLYNIFGAAGGVIRTSDGATILMPTSLSLDVNKPKLNILDSVKATARLTGVDGIPIKNANIGFKITSNNSDAVFLESGTATTYGRTGLDGEVDVNIILNNMKFGYFVQKEWVINNDVEGTYEIRLPYKLSAGDPGEVYLYFVTADDPILGKKYAETYARYNIIDQWQRLTEGEVEKPVEEYYQVEGKINSYQIGGRKIAWVKMKSSTDNGNYVLKTHYVKPTSIEINKTFTATFRELYILNTKNTITTDINALDVVSMKTPYTFPVFGYRNGILPQDGTMKINRATVNNGTVIKYSEPIPSNDQVIGFWLITGTGGEIDIQAFFDDKENLLYMESPVITVDIQNYIKSESEFILSSVELPNYNTALGAFSYYTVSEYINNPFHINSCSYGCKWSDPINGKCCHKNIAIRGFYLPGEDNGLCLHTYQRDESLPWSQTCPVVARFLKDESGNILLDESDNKIENPAFEIDAVSFINPFVLHIENSGA